MVTAVATDKKASLVHRVDDALVRLEGLYHKAHAALAIADGRTRTCPRCTGKGSVVLVSAGRTRQGRCYRCEGTCVVARTGGAPTPAMRDLKVRYLRAQYRVLHKAYLDATGMAQADGWAPTWNPIIDAYRNRRNQIVDEGMALTGKE